MGETIPTWKPTCNPSVSVQLSGRKTSCDGGAFLLREVMDRSGIFERLEQKLQDDRDPLRVRHSLISQLRTLIIQHAQGWDDLSDTQLLSEDPVFQLACSDQRSTTPLAQQRPSQPTLSRLLNLLAQDTNLNPLHEGLLDLAMWRLSSMRGGKPLSSLTLDVRCFSRWLSLFLPQAACFTSASFSGFSVTGPTGWQFLTGREPQRVGLASLACSSTALRWANSVLSLPWWRCAGVTKLILLWRCSVLYQRTKCSTHPLASSSEAKPLEGHCDRYLSTRNRDSIKALSLLTLGRL